MVGSFCNSLVVRSAEGASRTTLVTPRNTPRRSLWSILRGPARAGRLTMRGVMSRQADISTAEHSSSIHEALDGLDELLEREGLRQEHEVLALRQIARKGVVGVAGDENDLGVQSAFAQLRQHRRAVHFRHDDVRNDKVDRLARVLDDAQ